MITIPAVPLAIIGLTYLVGVLSGVVLAGIFSDWFKRTMLDWIDYKASQCQPVNEKWSEE